MIGLIKIADSKLESWMFGENTQELIWKLEFLLHREQNHEKTEELKTLIDLLASLKVLPAGKTKLTEHYTFVDVKTSQF